MHNDIWQNALATFRNQLSAHDFNTWFKPMGCRQEGDGAFVLEVPHAFFAHWIRDRYLQSIEATLGELTQCKVQIDFELTGSGGVASTRSRVGVTATPTPMELPLEPRRPRANQPLATPVHIAPPPMDLQDGYTFDTFVVGPSNQFCHAACRAVADAPARNYNPLFLYGGVGLGKTHLLHAIGRQVHRANPSLRIKYISSENYINELIQCIRLDRMDEFRFRYRSECDVLLIDDIQFIAGKDRTQEEFFHTFNSLYGSHKQIVLTSDRFPQEMPGLEERLRTRFQWGLIADIQPPEMETRIAILASKAEREGLALPEDVAAFLATHIKSNVRELEGSLIRLNAYASLTGRQVSLPMAKEVLKGLIHRDQRVITGDSIIKIVCGYFDVRMSDLKGPRRHRIISLPRMVAMYLCRQHTQSSFPEIGRLFGGRDHSTVINAVNKIERTLESDPQIEKIVHDLNVQLKG